MKRGENKKAVAAVAVKAGQPKLETEYKVGHRGVLSVAMPYLTKMVVSDGRRILWTDVPVGSSVRVTLELLPPAPVPKPPAPPPKPEEGKKDDAKAPAVQGDAEPAAVGEAKA